MDGQTDNRQTCRRWTDWILDINPTQLNISTREIVLVIKKTAVNKCFAQHHLCKIIHSAYHPKPLIDA